MLNKVVAISGFRPEKMPFNENDTDEKYLHFKKELNSVLIGLIKHGYVHFISGMAKGFDIWCAEQVIVCGGTIECAIPYPEQAESWDIDMRKRREFLIAKSTLQTVLCDSYKRGCYHLRNRYMVDKAEILLCAYDGRKGGGTAYTVAYALKQNKTVICINPKTFKTSVIK